MTTMSVPTTPLHSLRSPWSEPPPSSVFTEESWVERMIRLEVRQTPESLLPKITYAVDRSGLPYVSVSRLVRALDRGDTAAAGERLARLAVRDALGYFDLTCSVS